LIEFYRIFASGDRGSADLTKMFAKRAVKFEVHDIRKKDVDGNLTNLSTLMGLGLRSVPQVFTNDGTYVGDYAKIEKALFLFQ
jgi:hypothetical protein